MRRRSSCLLGMLGLVLGARSVAAEVAAPTEERCLTAYEQGQRLRKKHALLASRAELLLCAQSACPATFRPECVQWLAEVQELIPSIVVRLEGGDGTSAAADVRVTVDGVVVAERLDGVPIELDPGPHVVRFASKTGLKSEQTIVVIEGERLRVLTFTLPTSTQVTTPQHDEVKPPLPSASRSWTPWIFAGLGTVALGSFAYFGATGLSKRHELEQCTPRCQQGDIDATGRRFLVADVSLAVSIVSFGIATWSWLTPRVRAEVSSSGASIQISGAF